MNICVRFISDGIRDTLAHYRRDDLPLHRLSWELHTRIDTLVPHAPSVWIDQLRDLQRRVAEVAITPELTEGEHRTLDESLTLLADVLELAHS
ncbi:hypothetical protein [Pseudonocardia spinosispora]|uniref:hypothetical protein n=1 Tax=Pseudonocardia spinosispora TaxID=103441 RepID=UPI0003FC653B|nr:hypothetical protein [Pseudonocardia spinosispora]